MSYPTEWAPRGCDRKYILCAVINHNGPTPRAGHYTAIARHSDNRWYFHNDDRVQLRDGAKHDQDPCILTVSPLEQADVYMLFYKAV